MGGSRKANAVGRVGRTKIQGGWVVGFDGREHRLLRDGVVVLEGDRIVHVGAWLVSEGVWMRTAGPRVQLPSGGDRSRKALASL